MTPRRRRAFSLTELLVVIGVVALLMGLLLMALLGAKKGSGMAASMGNMRQIGAMLGMYAQDERDVVLASQFNHHLDSFVGHPRCNPALGEWHARGTWADVLWTQYQMGVFPTARAQLSNDYHNDSPDKALYDLVGRLDSNVLRSELPNSKDVRFTVDDSGGVVAGDGILLPFGDGAAESGLPGYFAANNFFNDDSLTDTYNGSFTYAQLKALDRSVYLVDSFAGETIEDDPGPWDAAPALDGDGDGQADEATLQVDFRYNDSCLLLFLDGHVDPAPAWEDLDELEARGVRVRELTRR
ncbi:MAG: prepilin-type N-terminal cleavage/methylation domain-containing protein [Planctomycetota bacterium]|jgi:prepilin-type N-terminal cleavage/methylation domain-containing protein